LPFFALDSPQDWPPAHFKERKRAREMAASLGVEIICFIADDNF
jgi:hypothetical protein